MKKENLNKSGRSMVEMLGVLAVVGLLTIIAIAGFKIAMNKAKANNLVADMNRLAHIVVMDKFSGYSEEAIQRAMNEHNQKTEYQAEYEYRTPQVFALKTKNAIDKTLCQQVASLGWTLPLAAYLNKVKIEGIFDEKQCTDENELIWAFTNDLSACPDCPLGDFDCTPYANRECGSCDSIGYTPKNEDCANHANGPYCVNGHCQACDVNQFYDRENNICESCVDDTSTTLWRTTSEYINACLGTMLVGNYNGPFIKGCHVSLFAQNYAYEEPCKACSNRCYNPDDQTCYSVEGANRLYSRISDKDGTCKCNYSDEGACRCPENHFWNNESNSCQECFDDTSGTVWYTTTEYERSCLGIMLINHYGGTRFLGCHSYFNAIGSSEPISCGACLNRCYNPTDQKCYLAGEGQAHQRVSADDGTCQE